MRDYPLIRIFPKVCGWSSGVVATGSPSSKYGPQHSCIALKMCRHSLLSLSVTFLEQLWLNEMFCWLYIILFVLQEGVQKPARRVLPSPSPHTQPSRTPRPGEYWTLVETSQRFGDFGVNSSFDNNGTCWRSN